MPFSPLAETLAPASSPASAAMGDLAAERTTLISKLRTLRWVSVILSLWNLGVILIGGWLMVSAPRSCSGRDRLPFFAATLVAVVRVLFMIGAARAQRETAETIVSHPFDNSVMTDPVIRHERRMRYKRWLWWSRFGMVVTALQFAVALYLMFIIVKDFSYSKKCIVGQYVEGGGRKRMLVISFLVLVWLVVIIPCLTGSDVLRWRSFYATHDNAWKAHYQEVFDHGIREALCCLGRAKYLTVLEEDEIYSVARLLGDLVAYRASGTGHLELLAGLALLQRHKQSPSLYSEFKEAPKERICEAAVFHPFAEAAYTGPLLDFGRNPILFPCAWLHRQGILTPWTRNRRPVLQGDNWWRGHAAAFLKYVKLSPEFLRKGRVCQTKREAAYFIVVLHDLRTVVITVRGTETPEDLITDGLCKECTLSMDDLDGLINSDHLSLHVRESVLSSFPHYGHSGILESARELFLQIDGQIGDGDNSPSEASGFLSSLLGTGCECLGYNIRIVGHSLGGAVATLLGIRLYRRYPNLHVYAYGPLPCVDSVIADACSDFVTSIVHNDEFSARLSVNSVLRLRTAAISALSVDSSADSAIISKLVRRILNVNKYHEDGENHKAPTPSLQSVTEIVEENKLRYKRNLKYTIKGGVFLCGHAVSCMINTPEHHHCSHVKGDFQKSSCTVSEPGSVSGKGAYSFTVGTPESVQDLYQHDAPFFDDSHPENLKGDINEFNNSKNLKGRFVDHNSSYEYERSCDYLPFGDSASPFDDVPSPPIESSVVDSTEMFLPGLIVHIVREEKNILPLWKSWRVYDKGQGYKAIVANRESFKDVVVTPYMFLDHLPWRCNYALQRVVERREPQGQLTTDLFSEGHIV